jgi:hypothetical protein
MPLSRQREAIQRVRVVDASPSKRAFQITVKIYLGLRSTTRKSTLCVDFYSEIVDLENLRSSPMPMAMQRAFKAAVLCRTAVAERARLGPV